jgi:hypothetical protein
MNLQKLDYFFPFFVFLYGMLIVFVLESGILKRLSTHRNIQIFEAFSQQLLTHKSLAWICFWVGGLWSLQNILF